MQTVGAFRSLAEVGNQESKASPKVLPRLKTMKTQTLPERFHPKWGRKVQSTVFCKNSKGKSQLGMGHQWFYHVYGMRMYEVCFKFYSSVYVGLPHCLACETTGPSGLQSEHHFVLNTGVRPLDQFGYIWVDCDPDLWLQPLLKTTWSLVIIIPNMIERYIEHHQHNRNTQITPNSSSMQFKKTINIY